MPAKASASAPATRGRKQVAKLTKRQQGFNIAHRILEQLANIANGVGQILHKGHATDPQTGRPVPLPCATDDIKAALSPEQLAAVEEFIATWSVAAPEQPAPPQP